MAYDPICGKKLQPRRDSPSAEYKKRTYWFCSELCRHEFERAAQRVRLSEAARAGTLLSSGKVRWGIA